MFSNIFKVLAILLQAQLKSAPQAIIILASAGAKPNVAGYLILIHLVVNPPLQKCHYYTTSNLII